MYHFTYLNQKFEEVKRLDEAVMVEIIDVKSGQAGQYNVDDFKNLLWEGDYIMESLESVGFDPDGTKDDVVESNPEDDDTNDETNDEIMDEIPPEDLAKLKRESKNSSYLLPSKMANDDDVKDWITVKGRHIPLKDGESKDESVKKFLSNDKRKLKESQRKPQKKKNGVMKKQKKK